MTAYNAFLIGGTGSGSGKTTLSLGIMAAMKKRGLNVQPFKCGPDFIDPTLHKMVTGRVSRNLDLRMCGESWCLKTFATNMGKSDIGIIEGVMGLYDGGVASSASLARKLLLPVVLVVDVRSAAESVAAVVKGFETYDSSLDVAGVIFNKVGSVRHEQLIRESVIKNCQSKILGFIPRNINFSIPDRHLGLHMGDESPLSQEGLDQLVSTMESRIDLDYLMTLQAKRETYVVDHRKKVDESDSMVRLGIAKDKAFCFYYQDNLEIFEQNGFELVFFSPLQDSTLPPDLDMIYFGGGYPELYSDQLSSNRQLIDEIQSFAQNGGFIYSECGGFMYLCDTLVDQKGQGFEMVGLFPMQVKMRKRLRSLGYREAIMSQDCPLGKKGEIVYGHEFHYSEIMEKKSNVETLYQLEDGSVEGYRVNNVIGGYLHLHFGRNCNNIGHLFQFIMKGRLESKGKQIW